MSLRRTITEPPTPFAGRPAVRMLAAPLTGRRRDVPEGLQAVVLPCLAKEPAERSPSAQSLESAPAGCPTAGWWTEEEACGWRGNGVQ